jgi:hypothetical protein
MIYIKVGYVCKFTDKKMVEKYGGQERKNIEDVDFDTGKPLYPKRKIIIARQKRRLNEKIILAVYSEKELHKYDIGIIKKHESDIAIFKDKEIEYYGFTHSHYLELIRKRKLKIIKELKLEEDNTIFGGVKKKVIVPEKIIPEHETTHYVEWDCWEDGWETHNSQRY